MAVEWLWSIFVFLAFVFGGGYVAIKALQHFKPAWYINFIG
jgi:hypothetical protein